MPPTFPFHKANRDDVRKHSDLWVLFVYEIHTYRPKQDKTLAGESGIRMPQESFVKQIEESTECVNTLRQHKTQANPLVPELFEELTQSLEELRVAADELRQQNEVLGESRLRVEQEQQRYQELFDLAPDGYFVTDVNSVIREANQQAGQMLGMASRYLIGKPLISYIDLPDRAGFRTYLSNAPRRTDGSGWEGRLQSRKVHPFPVAVTVSVTRSPTNRPPQLRWLVRAISERKAWEVQLQEANERLEQRVHERTALLETLLDAAPVGMAFLSPDFRFVHINEVLARYDGRTVQEHLGRCFWEVLSEAHWEKIAPTLHRALAGETLLNQEISGVEGRTPDHTRHFLFSCYPVRVGEAIHGIGVTVQDITARKQAEQAQGRVLEHTRHIADTLTSALIQTVSEDTFPGLSISTLYQAASREAQIGGDFFDAYSVDYGKVALVVGDVSGKGLAAATHIAEVKYALRAFLHETPELSQALARLNDFTCEAQRQDQTNNTSLVVLAVALIDPATGEVTYASAGAEPLLVLLPEADTVMEYGQRSGLVLGVSSHRDYQVTTLTLPPGGMLLMATDGITEARNSSGEMLGLEGLKRLILEARTQNSIGHISTMILDGARAHSGGILSDDACLLLVRRRV